MSQESTELAVTPEDQALIQAQDAEFDSDTFQTPILKIGQPLTKEVEDELAEAGEFINTLTGDALGDQAEFIVAWYNKGRFASDKDTGRAYVAFGDVIPNAWSDLVGEEFIGTLFNEYPDAEETFKHRVNKGEIEWGSGPLVSTTHNYTGFVIVSPVEGSDDEPELQPVRLSLQRTNMPAVRKFNTIKRAVLRNKPFWDLVFDLSTSPKSFKKGRAFLLNVKAGRKTTSDERAEARGLAEAVRGGRVTSNDEKAEADAPASAGAGKEPEAQGGLAV